MSGLVDLALGLILSLTLACMANNALSFWRELKTAQASFLRKFAAYIIFCFQHLCGLVIGTMIFLLFLIWRGEQHLIPEIIDHLNKTHKLEFLTGLYLAAVLFVVYLRRPVRS